MMPYLFWPEGRFWSYQTPPKKILIVGITGQDGSYLAEYAAALGHQVHGLVRRDPDERNIHLERIRKQVRLHRVDVLDERGLIRVLETIKPERVFNLAGVEPSHDSLTGALFWTETNGLSAIRLLEAIRHTNPSIRYFQASSSAIFGRAEEGPFDEASPIRPASDFGLGKALAHHATVHYRERYGLFTANGILFPHTSPRHSGRRLVRRITFAAANARLGDPAEVRVAGLDGRLDLGFAGDYVEAMWMALQVAEPGDYVIGTGVGRSVRDLLDAAFDYVEMSWERYVKLDPSIADPEVDDRVSASTRAFRLAWRPKVPFEQLVQAMIVSEFYRLEAVQKDPRRYAESTRAVTVRGPRPNWPLGRKKRRPPAEESATG